VTPEDLSLDNPPFQRLVSGDGLTLYRLARAKYANLSGVGAALFPGRWNEHGREALYTSTEISLTVLERLVHTPKDLIPSNLALMKIKLKGSLQYVLPDFEIELGTNALFYTYSTLKAANAMYKRGRFSDALAVALPSVVSPAWNVVFYPQTRGFWDLVTLEDVRAFDYDSRLFPPSTPIEDPGTALVS
jgi:RES domain-containing protein